MLHRQLNPYCRAEILCLLRRKCAISRGESIYKFKATVLQVHIIEFSVMEPPAIKRGSRGESNCRTNRTAINTKQLNTLTSTAMEGLQTNHHMPCELDIDGKPFALRCLSVGYDFLHLCSKIHSFTHRPYPAMHNSKYRALFFLNLA